MIASDHLLEIEQGGRQSLASMPHRALANAGAVSSRSEAALAESSRRRVRARRPLLDPGAIFCSYGPDGSITPGPRHRVLLDRRSIQRALRDRSEAHRRASPTRVGRRHENQSSRRWVPLDADPFEVLSRRAKLYPTGPLFPDRWSRSRLVQDMRKVATRARVPVVSANDFRRTFATFCGDSGVDETTCYRWMGHTSGAMIRRVYQQLSDRKAAKQGALLSQYKAEATTELTALHKAADDERD